MAYITWLLPRENPSHIDSVPNKRGITHAYYDIFSCLENTIMGPKTKILYLGILKLPLAWTNLELNSEFSDEGDFFPYDIVKKIYLGSYWRQVFLVVFRNIYIKVTS